MNTTEIFIILYLAAALLELHDGVKKVEKRKDELMPFVDKFGAVKLTLFVTVVLFVFSMFWPWFVCVRFAHRLRG